MVTSNRELELERLREPCVERDGLRDSRGIGDLLKELRDETTALLKQEVSLAKTEMSEKTSKVGRNVASLGAGGLIAYAGALFILWSLSVLLVIGLEAAGLSEMTAAWLGPMILGVAVALIGYAMLQKGLNTLKHENYVPEKTVETLKEDKEWIQHKVG